MAKTRDPLKKIRKICLSLPDTTEGEHFGSASFRLGKKMFTTYGEEKGARVIVVQLEPQHARELLQLGAGFTAYSRAKGCVMIDLAIVKNWEQIQSLVVKSYRLNAPSEPGVKKKTASGRKNRTTKKS